MGELASLIVGAFVGAFLGPLLLNWSERYRQHGRWSKKRKALIQKKFDQIGMPIISAENLMTWCLINEEDLNTLVLELGGEGVVMRDGKKGITLSPEKIPQDTKVV